jgi:hypothetical protein
MSQAVRQTCSHTATQQTVRQSCSEAAGQPGDSQESDSQEVRQSGRKAIGIGQSLLQSAQQSEPARIVWQPVTHFRQLLKLSVQTVSIFSQLSQSALKVS